MRRYNLDCLKSDGTSFKGDAYIADEVDAEIAEKDERYTSMFIQKEKAGVKIIKLEADVAELKVALKMYLLAEQGEGMYPADDDIENLINKDTRNV